jgi:hypothetical protein
MLEKLDRYGKAITLNFKGENTYKTKVGGLLSVLLMTVMAAYAIVKMVILINRS